MTTVNDTTRKHLRHVVDALHDQFDTASRRDIEEAVARSVDELTPRFEDFVPVLAFRETRETLQHRCNDASAA